MVMSNYWLRREIKRARKRVRERKREWERERERETERQKGNKEKGVILTKLAFDDLLIWSWYQHVSTHLNNLTVKCKLLSVCVNVFTCWSSLDNRSWS